MADRYFTPDEVERLIPTLTTIMARVMAAHAEAAPVKKRLGAEQERVAMAGGALIDAAAWRADRERIHELGTRVKEGLREVAELGGTPKDLDLGLIDFPHLRASEAVNLCWKFGESRIGYWHGLDEGYAARKPL